MKIKLLDLPPDRIYIKLDKKFLKKLFDKAIKIAGSRSDLAKILKNSNDKFSDDFKSINQQEIYGWYNNRRNLRLDMLRFLLIFTKISENEMKNNINLIKGIGTSTPIFNPNIEIELTTELANLIGKIYCDGSLAFGNSFTVTYNNTCNELIEEFKHDVHKVFGETKISCPTINGVTRARTTGLIGYVITHSFGKQKAENIPEQIIKADKYVKSGFLRAVFDDEGTVSKNGQIRLKMINKNFLGDIKISLKSFDVNSSEIKEDKSKRFGGPIYYFCVSDRRSFINFHRNISFTHPKKRKRLENRINSYKLNEYRKGEAQKLILSLLSKEGPKSAKEIAEELNRAKRTVQFHLNELKKKNLVLKT